MDRDRLLFLILASYQFVLTSPLPDGHIGRDVVGVQDLPLSLIH